MVAEAKSTKVKIEIAKSFSLEKIPVSFGVES